MTKDLEIETILGELRHYAVQDCCGFDRKKIDSGINWLFTELSSIEIQKLSELGGHKNLERLKRHQSVGHADYSNASSLNYLRKKVNSFADDYDADYTPGLVYDQDKIKDIDLMHFGPFVEFPACLICKRVQGREADIYDEYGHKLPDRQYFYCTVCGKWYCDRYVKDVYVIVIVIVRVLTFPSLVLQAIKKITRVHELSLHVKGCETIKAK